jgi:hypothetical protein
LFEIPPSFEQFEDENFANDNIEQSIKNIGKYYEHNGTLAFGRLIKDNLVSVAWHKEGEFDSIVFATS